MSYFQLKDTTGSGGLILRPAKLFFTVFCHAEHPRFAWISKMASWRPALQVLFRRIRVTSASVLFPIKGHGWIWMSHFKTYEISFTSILSS